MCLHLLPHDQWPIGARAGLAKTTPTAIIKKFLHTISIDPEPYGSHSLRRGGVTAAVAAGVDILVLARHGNWRSSAPEEGHIATVSR